MSSDVKTKIKFTVAYDGTDFCGWQNQSELRENNRTEKPSVSRTITKALEQTFKQDIKLFASGRTDAGVHALNQVCHFEVNLPEEKLKGWDLSRALKSKLPSTIMVKKAWIAPPEFHATISADRKTYRYLVYNSEYPSPFLGRNAGWMRQKLDLDFLNECSKHLLGEHDFKSFQSVGTEVAHTVRTIHFAQWRWRNPNVAEFLINGSGFLKQMVRNIVGTELLLHRKSKPASTMKEIIKAKDRRSAGPPADPQGLYLVKVFYPQDLDIKCREL